MHRLVVTGLVPVLFAAAGGAQQPRVLAETEYLSVLNESHPAVREAAEAVALAEARVVEAATLTNPVLGAVREDSGGSVRETEVVVSWRPPDFGRGAQIEARERELDLTRARFTERLLAHRLVMREAYSAWALSEDRQRRLSARAERVEALAEREAVRSERGEASGLEARRLGLAATALRARVALAAVVTERARGEVASWYAGLASDVRPALPEQLPRAPSLDGANAQVLAAEAELLSARLAREAAGRFIKSPEVSLGWQREEAGLESLDGPIVGLAWSVPLFDRKRAARDAADASIEGARARLELVEREVNTSRVAAWNSFVRLSAALAQARQELAVTGRMLDGAEAAFLQGEAGLTDLLETHRSVTEAELAMLDLHEAALAAHRELERLAGSAGSAESSESAGDVGDALAGRTPLDDNEFTVVPTEENTP